MSLQDVTPKTAFAAFIGSGSPHAFFFHSHICTDISPSGSSGAHLVAIGTYICQVLLFTLLNSAGQELARSASWIDKAGTMALDYYNVATFSWVRSIYIALQVKLSALVVCMSSMKLWVASVYTARMVARLVYAPVFASLVSSQYRFYSVHYFFY